MFSSPLIKGLDELEEGIHNLQQVQQNENFAQDIVMVS
jgi:hypothetical protein